MPGHGRRRGRTNVRLIYRASYITGSKTAVTPLLLLLLLFPCFFIVLFVSTGRCLPLSRLYIDHDATSSPIYPFAHPFSISIPTEKISQRFTFIFWRSLFHTRVVNECVPLLFLAENPSLSGSYSYLVNERYRTIIDITWSSFSLFLHADFPNPYIAKLSFNFQTFEGYLVIEAKYESRHQVAWRKVSS